MKREIKFRGRDYLLDWHYGALGADGRHIVKLHTDTRGTQRELYQEVDPATVGQYTGLKDENGNRIFDGDILEIDIPKTYPRDEILATITAVVEWVNDGFYAMQIGMNDPILRSLYGHSGSGCRVVGNIHDNPELLKGGGK